MKVVILAGGKGTRISEYTKDPKCLLKIGEYPIIYHQLKAIDSVGVKDVCIVVGYYREVIQKYVKDNFTVIKKIIFK